MKPHFQVIPPLPLQHVVRRPTQFAFSRSFAFTRLPVAFKTSDSHLPQVLFILPYRQLLVAAIMRDLATIMCDVAMRDVANVVRNRIPVVHNAGSILRHRAYILSHGCIIPAQFNGCLREFFHEIEFPHD